MHTVSVESLKKTYGEIQALRGLSFSVEQASMYGLIGPDGAGKTTFMRIAACLLFQTSGSITIGGLDTLSRPSEVKRIIGYMPQTFSLYQDLSVWENLTFYADLFGVSKKERPKRVEELLAFSRLGLFVNRRAGNLSGGMKQKLALCCTLIHTPKVLFLDEPTTGVDPVSRHEFWEILAALRRAGTTIIVTTPYMDEAERCDRVAFILDGTLIAEGTPQGFLEQFKNELLAIRGTDVVKQTRGLVFPDMVLEVKALGDRVHLTVRDADATAPIIQSFLEEKAIANVSVEPVPPSMEDVFVEKMGHAE